VEIISENACFDGIQGVYKHKSKSCKCDMTFAVYLPPQAKVKKVPVIWFLSGLTCTHENAMTKAGAQVWAAKYGVALVFPDTSPRGNSIANDDAYDLGQGAGFYVDAKESPWGQNFNMWIYITDELPELIFNKFQILETEQGIMGHSMGGHGALTIAMTLPERFRSVSAFSPICNPVKSEWGIKQFSAYLGPNKDTWRFHDSSILVKEKGFHSKILIDQGGADNFSNLLMLDTFVSVANDSKQDVNIRVQPGYDHSYYFIQTFMESHIEHHSSFF